MRKIYLIGDIDEESFKSFCEQMDIYEESQGDVELILNSIGGNALDAIAFMDRMRLADCFIKVTVYGLVGSAAVLVLAAGDQRIMTRNSWMMVHQDSHSNKNVPTTTFVKDAKTAVKLEKQWCKLLQRQTGTDYRTWYKLHKAGDLYLTPEQCLELGIVDEII